MLSKTEHSVDLKPLLEELSKVEWDQKNRSNLNQPTGHWLYDSYEITEFWKGSEFEKVLMNFPWPVGEARLMKLEPGTCYRSHADIDDRYHLNLIGNEYCHLIDLDESKMYQLIPDGFFYKMDAGKIHTATNFGPVDRVQLVIRAPLQRHDSPTMVKMVIKCKDVPYNFRYRFDKHVSPLINKMIKQKKIGWFNPTTETEMTIKIEQEEIEGFLKVLSLLDVKFLTLVE